jgi:signal transduction histidine kinase
MSRLSTNTDNTTVFSKEERPSQKGIVFKLLMMTALTGVVFIILVTAVSMLQINQARMIYDQSKEQLLREVKSVITFKSNTLNQVVFDYTFWDEFAFELKKGLTETWLEQNIATLTSSFGFNYIAVFDTQFNLVYEYSESDIEIRGVVPKQALTKLSKDKFLKFFTKSNSGLIEISAASVHTTSDREREKTEPYGYLFAGKLWDGKYLNSVKEATGATLSFINPSLISQKTSKYKKIESSINLYGLNEEVAGTVWMSRDNPLFRLYSHSWHFIVALLIISVLAIWLIVRYSIIYWVIKPLKLIEKILRNESFADIHKLKNSSGEFSKIGSLFEKYIYQKEDLSMAILMAQRADNLKTKFLANMSHEIRTPMNGIIGFSELLRDETLTYEQREDYINIIQRSGERMMSLMNDLINISKLESGQESVIKSSVELNTLFESLFSFFKLDADKKGLSLKYTNFGSGDNLTIITDREKLFGILNNLIKNAIKYSKQGTIEFGYTNVKEEVLFFVKDEGIGIDSELISRVFERFVQGEYALNKNYEGVGLGLSIAKAYSDLLGGRIWVESETGSGSCFYLTLPNRED